MLSRLSRKFDVEFNIRAGGIQRLPENEIGTLLTDISGEAKEVDAALAYLREQGVIVEKLSGICGEELTNNADSGVPDNGSSTKTVGEAN